MGGGESLVRKLLSLLALWFYVLVVVQIVVVRRVGGEGCGGGGGGGELRGSSVEDEPLLQFHWSSSAAAGDRHCWLLPVEELLRCRDRPRLRA